MFHLIATTLIFFAACLSFAEETHDFRKTRWGMALEEVKASESLKVAREDSKILVYQTKLLNKDVYLVYVFVDDKLVRARYALAEEHSNRNDFIVDYDGFQTVLKQKYGPPGEENTYWRNELYKDDPDDWGMAVSVGHLVYVSSWLQPRTEITTVLSGENYEISCIIEYASKTLGYLEDEMKEQEALDAL